MAIEIVDFPIKHGDFPLQTVSSPEGKPTSITPFFFVALRPTDSAWSVAKPSALHASLLLGPKGEMALEIYRMEAPKIAKLPELSGLDMFYGR